VERLSSSSKYLNQVYNENGLKKPGFINALDIRYVNGSLGGPAMAPARSDVGPDFGIARGDWFQPPARYKYYINQYRYTITASRVATVKPLNVRVVKL